MASKEKLRQALEKSNIAYDILMSKYKDLLKEYTDTLRRLSLADKELYRLQSLLTASTMAKINDILDDYGE